MQAERNKKVVSQFKPQTKSISVQESTATNETICEKEIQQVEVTAKNDELSSRISGKCERRPASKEVTSIILSKSFTEANDPTSQRMKAMFEENLKKNPTIFLS